MQKTTWMQLAVFVAAALIASFDVGKIDKSTQPRSDDPGTWRLIGQTTANELANHDVIVVAAPHDIFRRIKIKVTNAPLQLDRLVVTYDNGVVDQLPVSQRIPVGGESRSIDLLSSGERGLHQIEYWYDIGGGAQDRANLELFAMK